MTTTNTGAIRTVKMKFDIMIGDRFFATFRGMVNTHPVMAEGGRCIWAFGEDDINDAVYARYPSLQRRNFQIAF